jgi:cytochrome c peroxidase
MHLRSPLRCLSGVMLALVLGWGPADGQGPSGPPPATTSSQPVGETLPGFSPAEIAVIRTLSPLPATPPPDPTNAYADNLQAAELGRKLFWETRYSGPIAVQARAQGATGAQGEAGKMGCVQCHLPPDFIDTRSKPGNVSVGIKWTPRHAPALVNVAFYDYYSWAGKQDALWTQASESPESGTNTAGNRCRYAHMLWDFYRDEYNAVFTASPLDPALDPTHPEATRFPADCDAKKKDAAWHSMRPADQEHVHRIMANQGKAVAAFERRLISRNAPFDQFVAGDRTALSDSAKNGLKLFIGKAKCVLCHNGPFFTDQRYHNLGVPQVGPQITGVQDEDRGRHEDLPAAQKHQFHSESVYSDTTGSRHPDLLRLTVTAADLGAFRTPTLRNVARTAPYMHTGGQATLGEVIEFYNNGGGTEKFVGTKSALITPLHLTAEEQADLVAFLATLTGEPIPAPWSTAPQLPGL